MEVGVEPKATVGDMLTDEQLILFLHCCQHSLEASKQTIEAYYTIRTHAPELFGNRDTSRKGIQQTLAITEIAMVPNRDQHGNIVMAGHLVDGDASKFSYEDLLNAWFMIQDIILLEEGAVPGFVFLIDMTGSSLAHASKMHLTTVKKYYTYIQEAFPGKVVSTHLVNANPVAEIFLNLSKPFLKKDLADKIFVHASCEPLYQHVSKDALPKEFGGHLDSMTSYHKISLEKIQRYRDWFKEEETLRVDESKRLGKAKSTGDIFGVEGSFHKLDID